jgi:RNA exonuclease 4
MQCFWHQFTSSLLHSHLLDWLLSLSLSICLFLSQVLLFTHPRKMCRDTAYYTPLCPHRPRALKQLAAEELDLDDSDEASSFQARGVAHDSVQDARVALAIYNKHRTEWEKSIRRMNSGGAKASSNEPEVEAAEASASSATAAISSSKALKNKRRLMKLAKKQAANAFISQRDDRADADSGDESNPEFSDDE